MSSPSFLSDFSPRIRNMSFNPSLITLNSQSRNAISRMLKLRTLKDEISSFYARQSEGMPHIPSYLVNSIYAHLVKQQYDLFNKRNQHKNDTRMILAETTEVHWKKTLDEYMPTSSSSVNIGRKIPSAKEYANLGALLNKDNYSLALAIQDLRLPSAWDVRSKCDYIDTSSDRLQLTYTGDGKDGIEVASVRADHAMRRQCGIYYFEIQVISKGIDGHIGIGFCRKINSLNRFPGWEEHSWGYHAENGKIYSGPGTEKSYGPTFGTGDIIGCGIDFRNMTAFYTINGIYLGIAFNKIKETDIYPFVGFKTAGEKIEANFGLKPFKYDIKHHLANEKRELLNNISLKSIEQTKTRYQIINRSVENNNADKVVMEYLRHHGYNKSASVLENSIKLKSEQDIVSTNQIDEETMHRQEIRKHIIEGDIDKTIQLCNIYYPNVLENNPLVEFKLQCRKFMEMVKNVQSNIDQPTIGEYEAQSLQVSKSSKNSIKRTTSEADLESFNIKKKKQKMTDQFFYTFETVMAFGNFLKQKYGPESENNELMKAELLTTFSTLAYTDLSNKAVAYLYETPHIEIVASELNSAILVSLNQYPNSSIERIYRQTALVIEELVLSGNAKAALLEPERDCLKMHGL